MGTLNHCASGKPTPSLIARLALERRLEAHCLALDDVNDITSIFDILLPSGWTEGYLRVVLYDGQRKNGGIEADGREVGGFDFSIWEIGFLGGYVNPDLACRYWRGCIEVRRYTHDGTSLTLLANIPYNPLIQRFQDLITPQDQHPRTHHAFQDKLPLHIHDHERATILLHIQQEMVLDSAVTLPATTIK